MLTALASSWDGALVARSRHGEDPVQLWDLGSGRLVAQFSTVHEPGGARLAVSRDGTMLVAAAFSGPGVAAYRTSTGDSLWQRRDVRHSQRVAIDATGRAVWCVADRGPARLLEARHGETRREVRRAHDLFMDADCDRLLLFDGVKYAPLDNPDGWHATAMSDPLECSFGDAVFVASEITGPLRCFDWDTGNELYRVTPPRGSHWINVGLVAERQRFALVRYNYESGGNRFLDEFDPNTGRVTTIAPIPSPVYVFCQRGSQVLGTRGDLRSTSDGQVVGDLGWWSDIRGEYV